MRTFVIVYLIIITCAYQLNAQVIDYDIDPNFNTEVLFNRGSVSDIAITSQKNYMIMGMFVGINSPVSTGSMVNQYGNLVYPNIVGGQKVVEYRNGFLQYGSLIKHVYLPSVLSDFRFEFQKQAYTGPLSNVALDALVMPDDNILVAGRFFTDSTLMGTDQSHLGLRQLCMIDSTGAPVEGFPMLRCEWPTNAEIYTINKLSTGEYIIAGRFSVVEGHTSKNIAKLNADFSINTDFVSIFDQSSSGTVAVEFIDSNDGIWVNGIGSGIASLPGVHPSIVRILPDGNLDPNFVIPDIIYTNPVSGVSSPSFANLIEDHDQTFIISGRFTSVNGTVRKGLAKIDGEGNLIPGVFDVWGADEAVWGSWEDYPFVGDLTDVGDGKWLVGGRFSSFGGEPYSCLVRLQPSGFVNTENEEGRGKLKLWPNPVDLSQPFISLALPGAGERLELVEIFDIQGRVILKPNFHEKSNNKFDIQNLPPGVYVVKAASIKGVYSQKLVVQ